MRKIFSLFVLAMAATPAFANLTVSVPEPEVLSLMGIGMLAIIVSRKFKK